MSATPVIPGPADETDAEEQPDFISIERTAWRLGIERRQVYRMLNRDEIENVKIGRRRLVVRESLDEYIRRLRKNAKRSRGTKAA